MINKHLTTCTPLSRGECCRSADLLLSALVQFEAVMNAKPLRKKRGPNKKKTAAKRKK